MPAAAGAWVAPDSESPALNARLATLYGSPVCAMRCLAAVFWALFEVMVISSRRVGPRLPAKAK